MKIASKRWSAKIAALLFLMHGVVQSQTQAESNFTRSHACKELGLKFAKCALATTAKMPCPTNWDFVKPQRCKGDPLFDEGVKLGTSEFYAALQPADKRSAVSATSSASSVLNLKKEQKRRMTSAECRLMEVELPSAARRLGSSEIGYRKLEQEIKDSTDLPDATEAMMGYLVMYKSTDLRAFGYEMAADWAKKCNSGVIRARQS